MAGLSGLAALTAPDPEEPLAGVIDVAVVGARSDGKTQFLAHAMRTLRAYAPADLPAEERAGNDAMLDVVINARAPRTSATEPGRVQHFVFRLRPETLLAGLGFAGRLALVLSSGFGLASLAAALINSAGVWWVVAIMLGIASPVAAAGCAAAALLGVPLALWLARRRLAGQGEIEVVFWDVAGEHVYSGSARDYHNFLAALVHARRAQAAGRRYGFATVQICNPIAVGAGDDPPYLRLRQLMPLFAGLHPERPSVLTVVNRWELVREVCAPGRDADDLVAVMPLAGDAAPAGEWSEAPREPMPVVRRAAVQQHCCDVEPTREDDVAFEYLRYDAGMRAEAAEQTWPGWDGVPAPGRDLYAQPAEAPQALVVYRYAEGPGTFTGEAGRAFYRWLAHTAFSGAVRRPAPAAEPEPVPILAPQAHTSRTNIMYAMGPTTNGSHGEDSGKQPGFRSGGT